MKKTARESSPDEPEVRAHKRLPHEGEVNRATGDLEPEVLTKQREAHTVQRKWLNGMQNELRKGEK